MAAFPRLFWSVTPSKPFATAGRSSRVAQWATFVAMMGSAACGGAPATANSAARPGDSSSAPSLPPSTVATSASSEPPSKPAAAPTTSSSSSGISASGAATANATGDARPFAKNAAEATSFIDDAVESRQSDIAKCVQDARARHKDPHAKVDFDLGIDQEGTLIGVKTPKGLKEDKALNECIRSALRGAPFPKSNAGVVTVRKSYSGDLVYPK